MKNTFLQKHHILITGGNGLVGKSLTQDLLLQGHRVSHLSRCRVNRLPEPTRHRTNSATA